MSSGPASRPDSSKLAADFWERLRNTPPERDPDSSVLRTRGALRAKGATQRARTTLPRRTATGSPEFTRTMEEIIAAESPLRVKILEHVAPSESELSLDVLDWLVRYDPDWEVRRAAAEAAEKLGPDVLDILTYLVDFDPTPETAARAVQALGVLATRTHRPQSPPADRTTRGRPGTVNRATLRTSGAIRTRGSLNTSGALKRPVARRVFEATEEPMDAAMSEAIVSRIEQFTMFHPLEAVRRAASSAKP